jgi:hypothetical protein
MLSFRILHVRPMLVCVALTSLAGILGCGSDDNKPGADSSLGGSSGAAAGASSLGGASTTGGSTASNPKGGATGAGGSSTSNRGGTSGLGGTSATPQGGTSGTGSTSVTTGGTGNGGRGSGGSNVGGNSASGGSATGGTSANAGGGSSGGASIGGNPSGGGSSGGAATGGTSFGGAPSTVGGSANGGADLGGTTSVGGSGGGETSTGGAAMGGAAAVPSVTKDAETLLTSDGLTIVSYGGYLNGESFQQDGIVSYAGYQYAAFWNVSRHVVMARRQLPEGAWSTFEFTDYTNSEDDAHNTISLGLCPGDGTLHLSFDHHSSDLHYRKSVEGLITNPATATWAAGSFSAVTSALVGSTALDQITYPRFVTEPDGNKMLFGARYGTSGSGDELLWEYDSTTHTWISLGVYISGIATSINAYPHGLSYTRGGSRLHMSWCWRETPDASTNHDLYYITSDDNGHTWQNDSGTTVANTGTSSVSATSPGTKVWTINQNRGLINQEHMVVDSQGRVHVLLAHMPDTEADDSDFTSARTKSQYFHYFRDINGTWSRTPMGLPVVANLRGKLALLPNGNLYAILPDLRIAAASAASNYTDWALLDDSDSGRFFSDPLIDTARLETENRLTVFYPEKSSPNIYVLDYTIN